jgi:glycosyltransferase involved in cell wall biosynthesis
MEIIIINDGSSDNSREIIMDYLKRDSRIVFIDKMNEGVTIARNTGLKQAKGEYVFFLDGDDYLEINALEKMYWEAKIKSADWIIGDFILEYPDGRKIARTFYDFKELDNMGFLKYCFIKSDFYFTGRLIKKKLFESYKIEIPKEITFGEDNIAVVQLAYHAQKVVKINIPVLYYVQRISSVTNKLRKTDLIQRANACVWILRYAKDKGFYDEIRFEIEVFMLKEIYAGIVRGYLDSRFLDFLQLPFIKGKYRKYMTLKAKFFLLLAFINPNQAIKTYQIIRKLK